MGHLTIRCPKEQWRAFARARGMSVGAMVREAVAEMMEEDSE